jgi:probable DNA metabolism protein
LNVPENFLFYLSAHESCTKKLLAEAKNLTAGDLETSPDPKAVRMRKMVYSVRTEIHRMKGFVRLKPLGKHVLYGYLKPRHRTGGYITERFARRSPGVIAVLGHSSESWISIFLDGKMISQQGDSLAKSLKEIESALNCSEDLNRGREDVAAVWETYYASQYSPERRNVAAFHRRMPKEALASAGLILERNKNGVTLDDFFGRE